MTTASTNTLGYDDLLDKLLRKYDPANFRKQLAIEFQGPLPTLPEELAAFYKEIGPNEWRFEVRGHSFYLPALHRLDDLEQPYQDSLVFLVIDEAHWVLYHTSGRVFKYDVKAKKLTKIEDSFHEFLTAFTEIATSDDRQRVENLLKEFGL